MFRTQCGTKLSDGARFFLKLRQINQRTISTASSEPDTGDVRCAGIKADR